MLDITNGDKSHAIIIRGNLPAFHHLFYWESMLHHPLQQAQFHSPPLVASSSTKHSSHISYLITPYSIIRFGDSILLLPLNTQLIFDCFHKKLDGIFCSDKGCLSDCFFSIVVVCCFSFSSFSLHSTQSTSPTFTFVLALMSILFTATVDEDVRLILLSLCPKS